MKKPKYFNRFFNQKEFFRTEIEPDFFNQLSCEDLSWYEAKLLLKHKSCTDKFRNRYVHSKIWYERLVACLAKPARAKYAVLAMKDPDNRVRTAAFHGSWGEEVITSIEAANLVYEYYNTVQNGYGRARTFDLYSYAINFIDEWKLADKSPSLGLLSPNEDIRRITKERLDVLSKVQR